MTVAGNFSKSIPVKLVAGTFEFKYIVQEKEAEYILNIWRKTVSGHNDQVSSWRILSKLMFANRPCADIPCFNGELNSIFKFSVPVRAWRDA